MLDNANWYRQDNGLDQFISWLDSQGDDTYEWDDCENCLFARYAKSYGLKLGQAWYSLHSDGRVAMELYCQIGGDDGGRRTYADALARAKHWQARPTLADTVNRDMD
jgi:hypothetical protein